MLQTPEGHAQLTLYTIYGAAAGYAGGGEITVGSSKTRLAPFGNRTGHPTGRFPHYHRRVTGKNGKVKAGQGIKRHRPWDKKTNR